MADAPEQPTQLTGQGGGWAPLATARLQEVLPGYEVIELLGVGGMGAVYKARQRSLKRLVAIKILPVGAAEDEFQFVARFRNEAETLAQLNHPAIVNVYDFGETPNGLLYFVMEYVEGTDLQKLIQSNGTLTAEQALRITAHVCDALSYAHRSGVVHRDIKPANILINREGHVKVADFGLAKMQDATQGSGLTLSNMTMGTPDYAAPEVFKTGAAGVDHRADLYAVGVMLYQMLTGEVPRGFFKLPSERGADPRFDAIIVKAMETDRDERYQSAIEVRHALDEIVTTPLAKNEGSGAISASAVPPRSGLARQPQVPPTAPAPAPASSGKTKWLVAAAAAVVVLARAGWFVVGDKHQASRRSAPAQADAKPVDPAEILRSVPTLTRINEKPTAEFWASIGATPAGTSSTQTAAAGRGEVIDWINGLPAEASPWSAEWGDLKDGVLTSTAKAGRQFGFMRDGSVRMRVRLAPDYRSAEGYGPMIQLDIRNGVVAGGAGATAQLQFQVYVPQRDCNLVYIERAANGVNVPGASLWSGQWKRVGDAGNAEVEWEFRAQGDELSAWANGKLVHSIRDARVSSGLCTLGVPAGVQITRLETVGLKPTKPSPPKQSPLSAVPASDNWTDRLNPGSWRPPWEFENGALKSTVLNKSYYVGRMRDGAVRIHLRTDRRATLAGNNPPLQLTVRSSINEASAPLRAAYQFQIYPHKGISHLLFLQKDTTTGASLPPNYVWADKAFPTSGDEIDLEFCTEGDEISLRSGDRVIASVRDARVTSGSCVLLASPGVGITAMETRGIVLDTAEDSSPPANAALPEFANWHNVTDAIREKARGKPELAVDSNEVHHSGNGNTVDISLLGAEVRDRAVWVRYVGEAQVSLWFKGGNASAFVLAQRHQTIFQRADRGASPSVALRPAVPHPAGFDATQAHELLVAVQGTKLRAWLDGHFVGEAQDADIGGSSTALVFTKLTAIRKVEIAELEANVQAEGGEWQPIFMKRDDFGDDLRDVEFRDGATFIKGRTFRAPSMGVGGAIRATLRFCGSDRTGSLTIRSTESAVFGEEAFACTAYLLPNGAGAVMHVRDRSAGIGDIQRNDFALSPGLKVGESFTLELRAEGGKIALSVNGRQVGAIKDTWKTGPRRLGITPSNAEFTEFRDVAVRSLSANEEG